MTSSDVRLSDLLFPIGIRRANLDPLSKGVLFFLWHLSDCCLCEFSFVLPAVLAFFGIEDSRAAKRVLREIDKSGLIEIFERRKGGRTWARFTNEVWSLGHPLSLYEPAAEFGGNPALPGFLIPDELFACEVALSKRLLGWFAIWDADLRTRTAVIDYATAKNWRLDRSNFRKIALALPDTGFFKCVENDGELKHRWLDGMWSDEQLLKLSLLATADLSAAARFLRVIQTEQPEVNGAHDLPRPAASQHDLPKSGAHDHDHEYEYDMSCHVISIGSLAGWTG